MTDLRTNAGYFAVGSATVGTASALVAAIGYVSIDGLNAVLETSLPHTSLGYLAAGFWAVLVAVFGLFLAAVSVIVTVVFLMLIGSVVVERVRS